ncbi:MAG TPA: MlaD family protein [Solirubrobacteraceae bacterium]|jgi:virulence factor Mce-like protein|nr:MlaD family protein [Solirubrobacteraceae bacterium]
MNTLAPSRSRIMVMALFAGSCLGLLLFLWISFGGSVPLTPQGYRFSVEFPQATELASQSDVRIAGVSVGHVVSVRLDRRSGLSRAVIQVDTQYAPRPADTRAILRQKTLLGEAYVELSHGNPRGPFLSDDGRLPEAQVAPTVQLDQVLSTFDPTTRRAFETWMQQDGMAFTNRGQDFNDALAELYPFATNVDNVLTVLRRDGTATRTLLSDGSQVLGAISRSPAALRGLIRNSNAVFAATNARNRSLASAVRVFPSFLVGTRQTVARVDRFAGTTKPLVDELRPAAVQLTPALTALKALAPQLRTALVYLGPVTAASRQGVPALDSFLNQSKPLLGRLTPYLGGVVPVLDYINAYRRELAAFFANGTASTQATAQNIAQTKLLHYLRVSAPVNPESLTAYAHRPYSNRSNPYLEPGGYTQLRSGLPVFGRYLCTSNPLPVIGASTGSLAAILRSVYYTANPDGPPCRAQAPLGTTISHLTGLSGLSPTFPQLQSLP